MAKKDIPKFTHAELIAVAAHWLKRKVNCHAVIADMNICADQEIPDAIGFGFGGKSVLIECKSSRSDFFVDAQKPFRMNPDKGMGLRRYFLTPKGLLGVDEMPSGWGLLEVDSANRVYVTKKSAVFTRKIEAENRLLIGMLRRVQIAVKPSLWRVVEKTWSKYAPKKLDESDLTDEALEFLSEVTDGV